MRHSGQRPYKCKFCPYNCIQSISMKMHMRNKHKGIEDGIFACQLCPFRSVNEKNFKYHLEDHKNGLVPESLPEKVKAEHKVIVRTAGGGAAQGGTDIVENALIAIQSDGSEGGMTGSPLQMQVRCHVMFVS